jgi:Domain of unknown function (DUF4258)
MEVLIKIRIKIALGLYELSKHAADQSIVRNIGIDELAEALIHHSELIEDYPADKYGPSCLILGFTDAGRALHLQCSYPERPLVKIITLYEPDPKSWINLKSRVSH